MSQEIHHNGFAGESTTEKAKRARTVKGIPTAIGLFVGGGGLDLGFRQAGFQILAATDFEPCAEKTYKRNNPDVPFILEDVRKLTVARIVEVTEGRRPDVVIGGPPCQGFSTLGDRLSADPRNALVDALIRIVDGLRPQAVVIENVRAIATEYKGRFRDHILKCFEEIGYKMHFSILNAADFGVPQHRRRAVFVGFADPRIDYVFPSPTHGDGLLPYETVGNAINDLARKNNSIPNHEPLRHSDIVIQRYRLIPEGGMLPPPDQLPKQIRRANFGNTYKRLHRKLPSLTIVPGNNALPIHPNLDRSLTPREAARIQSFPDDHIFEGDRRRQCILVGYTKIEHRIIDAANYGVPQRRKRFLLIANRTGHVIPWPKQKYFESPDDWQKPFRTVEDAISDLATPLSYSTFTCHVPMNHKPLQIERYKRIPEGGKLDTDSLPSYLKKGYRTDEVKNFSHVFKRLHRNKPSNTIVPGHNAFAIHPYLDRALTVREAARLQTFPDEITFKGSREEQCIQVGNAFPPLLAELIANNIIKAESNNWIPGSVPKLAQYTLLDMHYSQPELLELA